MSINLLYPIGNSDIYVNGTVFKKREVFFVEFTQFIWKNKELFMPKVNFPLISLVPSKMISFSGLNIEEISFPIFGTILYFIKETYYYFPNRVYLFATKQENTHPNDTYFLAQILQHISKNTFLKKGEVEIELIEENPSDFALMNTYFTNFAQEYEDILKDALYNFVQTSTGTPAIAFNLSFSLFPFDNVKYLYTYNANGESIVKELKYFQHLNIKNYLNILKTLIKAYEYSLAIELVNTSPLRKLKDKGKLITFLEIGRFRRDLDFQSALERAKEIDDDIPKQISKYLYDIRKDDRLKLWASLEEMEIYIERREYHPALASYFNIMENLIHHLISLEGEDPDNLKKKEGNKEWYYNMYEKRDWLRKKALNKRNNSPYTIIFDKDMEELDKILREARNKGPFAHGFSGIDEKVKGEIEKAKENLKRNLLSFSPRLFPAQMPNFYKYLNKVIYDYMEEIQANL